jgi:hypothetical protein
MEPEPQEAVAEKGYHGQAVMLALRLASGRMHIAGAFEFIARPPVGGGSRCRLRRCSWIGSWPAARRGGATR